MLSWEGHLSHGNQGKLSWECPADGQGLDGGMGG